MDSVSRSHHPLTLAALTLLLVVACGSRSAPSAGSSSPTPTPMRSTASAPVALPAPTRTQIRERLRNVVEVGYPGTHFSLIDGPITVSDGAGHAITAVVGVRWPTADAKGQLIFFWHDRRFIGWAPTTEAYAMNLDPRHAGGK